MSEHSWNHALDTKAHCCSSQSYISRKCSFRALGVVKAVLFILILNLTENTVHGFLPGSGSSLGDSLLPSLSSVAKTFSESDLGKTIVDVANKLGADKIFKETNGSNNPLNFLQSALNPNSTTKNIVFIPAGASIPLLQFLKNDETPEFGSDADSKEERENDNSLLKVLAEINRRIFGGKQPDYKLVDSGETEDEETKDDGTTYYD
ncbi:hypothetical protein Ocin01_13510 [Orchesella cincta]|uniref:Uncharacterized protein n=1 Tax=Orchesella cincta TaxID=48709 RepID=A0A1D2MJM4_ORCCI|nr:hypothetical protein Ocin01_13510 [Orchesella cincta]